LQIKRHKYTLYLIYKMSIESEYKQFISDMTADEISSLGDDYTSCWLFAYFIHKKYDLPVDNYDTYIQTNVNL